MSQELTIIGTSINIPYYYLKIPVHVKVSERDKILQDIINVSSNFYFVIQTTMQDGFYYYHLSFVNMIHHNDIGKLSLYIYDTYKLEFRPNYAANAFEAILLDITNVSTSKDDYKCEFVKKYFIFNKEFDALSDIYSEFINYVHELQESTEKFFMYDKINEKYKTGNYINYPWIRAVSSMDFYDINIPKCTAMVKLNDSWFSCVLSYNLTKNYIEINRIKI